jgi:hypothetical protein
MNNVLVDFRFDDDIDAEGATLAIESLLAELEPIDQYEATAREPRIDVVEAATVITAAVTLVRSGREMTVEVERFVEVLAEATRKLRGLRGVTVQSNGERIEMEGVGEA